MEKVRIEEGNAALERVLLMMNYDMKKTLKENKGLVNEQDVPKGYLNIVGAAEGGFGTDENRLVRGFQELESAEDFANLNRWYKAKWGREIPYLLRKELGMGDAETAKQIADHLAKIGMKMTYSITANRKGVVSDSIKISYVKQPQKKEEPKKTEPKKPSWVKAPVENDVKTGKKVLKSGMAGEFVKKVQQTLNDIASKEGNSNVAVGKVDGYFGNKTMKGLQNFQISAGLKGDGVLGKDTYSILFRETSQPTNGAAKGLQPTATPPQAGQVQRSSPIPSVQTSHVDPKPTIKESMKKQLKTKLVEKTKEKENLIVETKIINNRFNLLSEGLVIETVEDQIRFIDDIIVEMNYMVSQGYTSQVINEGLFSMLGSLFGGSVKSVPAVFGEYIANWLTKTLGVPEGSFIQSSIVALVGNLNIADYDKFFTDCRFASNKIADSLIEGYLIQMQKRADSTSQGATGFIVSALRNAVSEYFLEDKDGIIQILQDKIGDFICPKLSKVSSVIADKADDIKDRAVA
jgi:peptidoglycan hydrolase-like protein with peptidoglycan-binding domain